MTRAQEIEGRVRDVVKKVTFAEKWVKKKSILDWRFFLEYVRTQVLFTSKAATFVSKKGLVVDRARRKRLVKDSSPRTKVHKWLERALILLELEPLSSKVLVIMGAQARWLASSLFKSCTVSRNSFFLVNSVTCGHVDDLSQAGPLFLTHTVCACAFKGR